MDTNKVKVDPLRILNLSTSSMKTYEQCPRKYYYQYIEKPQIEKKDWPHTRFGSFVHTVLESFHNEIKENPDQNIRKLMGRLCEKYHNEYRIDEDQHREAMRVLSVYLDNISKDGMPNVLVCEQQFKIQLAENLFVNGYIDRIDINDEDGKRRYIIRDLKTGKSKYLDEFQLLVYGLYLLTEHPEVDEFDGSYLVLKENKDMKYVFSREDVNQVKQKILKIASEIREDQTWAPVPQFLCSYCDFEGICDASSQFKRRRTNDTW